MSDKFKNITELRGLYTDAPADKIPLGYASDILNMDLSRRGLIQTQKGFTLYGKNDTEVGKGLRGFLFKKNFGSVLRVRLRVVDNGTNSKLQWYNASNPEDALGKWEDLVTGLTSDAVMGFLPFNTTNENTLVFCNAVENFSVWTGATSLVSSVTTNTIVTAGTLTLAEEGFASSGTVEVNGSTYTYSGLSSKTFTGVSPDPAAAGVVANEGIADAPDTSTYAANPKGNVLLTASARVWVAGIAAEPSSLYASKVADYTNFTAGTNPRDALYEDFPDAGGPITFLDSKDNNNIIIHKEDGILQYRIDYTATAQVPNLDVLSLADDAGASNLKAGAGISAISYFTSRREGIKSIARAKEGDRLNMDSITDIILPTLENFDLSDAANVYFPPKRVIMVACKSSPDVSANDRVISYYLKRGLSGDFIGDISIDELNVADFIVDRDEMFFVSSVTQNTYKMFDTNAANGVGRNHKWTSGELSFDEPARGKEFDILYVEGLIAVKTKIKITVAYGPYGIDGTKTYVLAWDDDVVNSSKLSAMGDNVLGTLPMGAASADFRDSFPFSVPIHFDVTKSTRYTVRVATYYDDDTTSDAFWSISNVSTNPVLDTYMIDKTVNSNS